MKWQFKSLAVLAVLSRIPAGQRVYHRLQKAAGTNKLDFEESLSRTAELVDLAREGGKSMTDATCVEVGTGWRPFIAMALRLAGARRVITFDVNPWLDIAYASETAAVLQERAADVAEALQVPEADVRRRLPDRSAMFDTLAQLLEFFHIEYRCPGDARHTGLNSDSIDFVLSSNVLEHVPPDVLGAIHQESRRILRLGGLAVHRFNPGDHFAHVDGNITGANFLKFSQRAWHWRGGSGLAYHNRLRCVQHRALLEQAGFQIVVERERRDVPAEQAIESGTLKVHGEFAGMTTRELTADYMWLVGRAPAGAERPDDGFNLSDAASDDFAGHAE